MTSKTINLVEGLFTPSEASDVIIGLIDKKLNFHKLNRLSLTEGNHDEDVNYDNSRIEELEKAKEELRNYLHETRSSGAKLQIEGTVTITPQ